jgi:hypothetical protein
MAAILEFLALWPLGILGVLNIRRGHQEGPMSDSMREVIDLSEEMPA